MRCGSGLMYEVDPVTGEYMLYEDVCAYSSLPGLDSYKR